MKSLADGPGAGGCTPAGGRVAQRLAIHQHAEVVVVAIHRRELEADIGPVRVEFLRQQHRQRRGDALAHLGAMDAADHRAVRCNLQPGVERCAGLTAGREFVGCGAVIERGEAVSDDQPAAEGETRENEAPA